MVHRDLEREWEINVGLVSYSVFFFFQKKSLFWIFLLQKILGRSRKKIDFLIVACGAHGSK